jgi:exopolysaccharide biosynthesis operon protein EpsL
VSVVRAPRAGKLVLPMILGTLFSLPAKADFSDTIHPFAAAVVNHDNNLLRIDQDANPGVDAADTYRTIVAGIDFDRPIGRQRVYGLVKASKVSFDRYSSLDYTGKDANINLDWAFASHLTGHAGLRYNESLGSFSDFHSSVRNLRINQREFGDVFWRLHPLWQVHTGFIRDKYRFDLPSQAYNNRTEDMADVGFDFLEKSGSTVGLVARRLKGYYPNTAFGNVVIDNGYHQNEIKLNVYWLVSGATQVTFLGGRVRRTNNSDTLRGGSGNNGRLIANWGITPTFQVSAAGWREFGIAESVLVNNSLNTGESLSANWSVTPKIGVNGLLQQEKREFRARPGLSSIDGLSDRTRNASLGVNYQVLRKVTLGVSGFINNRSGSAAAFTNSYRSKGVSASASVKF